MVEVIDKIETSKYSIQINRSKLEKLKQKYRITDWNIQFDFSFSLLPNTANWNNKKIIIRPINIWSYIRWQGSLSEERIARVLAHEVKHAQQKPSAILRLIRHFYWYAMGEVEARRWADEHWQEFIDIVKINKK